MCEGVRVCRTGQETAADSDEKDNEPTGPSVPHLPGAPPPAELTVAVEPLVSDPISVPVPHPVNGVEIIVVPAIYSREREGVRERESV